MHFFFRVTDSNYFYGTFRSYQSHVTVTMVTRYVQRTEIRQSINLPNMKKNTYSQTFYFDFLVIFFRLLLREPGLNCTELID